MTESPDHGDPSPRPFSRVVVVENATLIREALSALINSFVGFRVISGPISIADLDQISGSRAPDVVVIGIDCENAAEMERLNAIAALRAKPRIVVVGEHLSLEQVSEFLLNGFLGILTRSSHSSELQTALECCISDRRYISSPSHNLCPIPANAYVLDEIVPDDDPLADLSKRQREIFFLLASGLPQVAIAKKLFISPRTVESHRSKIVKKLNIRTNTELIRFAIKNKLAAL